ncbi:ABC transporter ATP-binding protein [Sphingomonas sp. SM33]|uniref:ABC transporter ATP-binding protein n=1 Tax=Sphingomonas telluris TaxID=2907998 RepID=A0ABS9VK42_9SPHN|nr:ABC transporter ATP-binding protein [Sphingomonas telluris]MCH8615358.1 ABC transporter ATP-binding protein [Sphingomonas telluris]
MTPLLKAQQVAIDGRLSPADLEVDAGQMVAVVGPNGAGKTSLLRALAGIELDSGGVSIDGEDIASASPARRMHLLSFLPATRGLVWPINARDVIGLGLPTRDPERVDELIELLELDPLANRPVNSLSTGERSRVLLARALAAKPQVLLLDEPLSNLDPYWVIKTLQIVREATVYGCAVLASLHDLAQMRAFDRAILVNEGTVAADRTPMELMHSPELADAFRIESSGEGWRISPAADRRSSR